MDKVVRLRHAVRQGDWMMYFYDGELPVENSILTIPANRPEWIQRAWIMGFRTTADGRVIADLAKHIRAETQPDEAATPATVTPEVIVVESAESAEENTDEGPDRGGQPAGEDGVRSSEPDRGEGDAGGGDAGSGSSEPAEG